MPCLFKAFFIMRSIKIGVPLLLFFTCGIIFSQTENTTQQKKDSIFYLLKNAKGKSLLIDLKKAVYLAEEIKDDSLIKVTNIKFGLQSYFKKNTVELAISQKNLSKLYLRTKDSFALAKTHHYKALYHLLNFKKDSALYYYVESKNISALIKDSLEVGRRLLSMANIQREGNDYLGSEISSIEGLSYLEPIKDYKYTGDLYNNLGILLKNTNQYNEARIYFKKSKEKHKNNPNKRRKELASLNILNNIGNTYVAEKNYDKAIGFFKKGLEFENLASDYPTQYYFLLENLSDSYRRKKDYDKAIIGLRKALKLKQEQKDYRRLSTSHNLLSLYYRDINNHKLSLYHVKKGLEYAKKTRYIPRQVEALQLLSNSKIISQKEANGYLKRYIYLKDSLFKRERSLKNQFAKIRYETGKKEKENTALKIENNHKKIELKQEKQQKIIGFLLAIGSLLLLGISFLVFKQRRKKLAYENQLQKAEARELERQQIAKSLHDEVAGDLRMLHQQLEKNNQVEVANQLNLVKNNVRDLSHQLSSVHFEEVSFKDQIINLISDYFSVECKILITGLKENNWKNIKNPIKRTLYLSTRESLQNAIKYAKASQIKIDFKQDKNWVFLTIDDNGNGFDTKEKANGIGLKNLRERIEEINGKLKITSAQNKGTNIKIEVPIHV